MSSSINVQVTQVKWREFRKKTTRTLNVNGRVARAVGGNAERVPRIDGTVWEDDAFQSQFERPVERVGAAHGVTQQVGAEARAEDVAALAHRELHRETPSERLPHQLGRLVVAELGARLVQPLAT